MWFHLTNHTWSSLEVSALKFVFFRLVTCILLFHVLCRGINRLPLPMSMLIVAKQHTLIVIVPLSQLTNRCVQDRMNAVVQNFDDWHILKHITHYWEWYSFWCDDTPAIPALIKSYDVECQCTFQYTFMHLVTIWNTYSYRVRAWKVSVLMTVYCVSGTMYATSFLYYFFAEMKILASWKVAQHLRMHSNILSLVFQGDMELVVNNLMHVYIVYQIINC